MAQKNPLSTFPALSGSICCWSTLSTDLTELILSFLPVRSIVVSGAVCKFWKSIINHPSFAPRVSSAARSPWFFLYGQNNVHLHRNQAFAFDPVSDEWLLLPPIYLSREHQSGQIQVDECFVGSGGFIFATSASTRSGFCYAPLLRTREGQTWRETPPLKFSRRNPVVGVINRQGGIKFIVAGGVRFVGGLVDIEEQLAVEIFDSDSGIWKICAPLPQEFSNNSFQELSSALIGTNSFFVFGIHSCLLAKFDLSLHSWSQVRILQPPGVHFAFLVAAKDFLVMAGLRNSPPSLALWRVEDDGAACSEIGEMPHEMLLGMFEGEEEERFTSLRCVGTDGLLYVFNEAHHGGYPACVCEISTTKWRELPRIPFKVNRFHRVIAFSSSVPLESVLSRS